jgi:hypothetical protein
MKKLVIVTSLLMLFFVCVQKKTETKADASSAQTQDTVTNTNVAETGRSLVIKYVEDLTDGKAIPNTKIHVAYYDMSKSKWVSKSAVTNANGIANFKIPVSDDGASYPFLHALSDDKLKKEMANADNGKRYLWRMHKDTKKLELWITAGDMMSNKVGDIQMWSK